MGDCTLCIPIRELVRLDASQAQANQNQDASPVAWAPAVADGMVNSVIRMVQRILD